MVALPLEQPSPTERRQWQQPAPAATAASSPGTSHRQQRQPSAPVRYRDWLHQDDGQDPLPRLITCYGENILYRNEGQGHFVDASAQMGVGDGGFGAGAAAGDWDLDEDLYVYVVNSLDALEQAEAGYRRAIELKPKAREICIW